MTLMYLIYFDESGNTGNNRGDEALQDVLAWISAEEKKKRPGT